jgi:hypothetical protein
MVFAMFCGRKIDTVFTISDKYFTLGTDTKTSSDQTQNSYDQFGTMIDPHTGSTSRLGDRIIYLDDDTSVARVYYSTICLLLLRAVVRIYEVREF